MLHASSFVNQNASACDLKSAGNANAKMSDYQLLLRCHHATKYDAWRELLEFSVPQFGD